MTVKTDFYYARLVTPQTTLFDCIECGAEKPIMEGCAKCVVDDTIAAIKLKGGLLAPAYFCKECFDRLAGDDSGTREDDDHDDSEV